MMLFWTYKPVTTRYCKTYGHVITHQWSPASRVCFGS